MPLLLLYELTCTPFADTNILLRHLHVLQDLVNLLHHPPPQLPPLQIALVVPHVVVSELDGLKNSDRIADERDSRSGASIAALARRATSWILDIISEEREDCPTVLRGQKRDETLLERDRNGRQCAENNDALVLDAGLYHLKQGTAVALLSDDKNLCLRARIEGLVDAFGIKEGTSAKQLLERLDPSCDPTASVGPSQFPSQSAASTSQPSPIAIPSSPVRRPPPTRASSIHSPPPRHPPSITPSAAKPIPLASSRDMELEVDPSPPPAEANPYAPTLKPIRAPSDVFFNICEVFVSFVAARLYRQVYDGLLETRTKDQHRWIEELGDGRLWEARDCVRIMKEFWEDGGVKDVCTRGLEREPSPRVVKEPPAPAPHPPSAPTRSTQASRWANPTTSTSQRRPSPPPIARPSPRIVHNRPRLAPGKRIAALHTSLSILRSSLSSPASDTNSWSAPRWEVLVEGIGELLVALLGGWFNGDVEQDVRNVVEEWAGQLRDVGVQVELDEVGL